MLNLLGLSLAKHKDSMILGGYRFEINLLEIT